MSKHQTLAPLPLLAPGGGLVGGGGPGALKTSSLSRLPEMQQFLHRCDDQNYLRNYIKARAGRLWVLPGYPAASKPARARRRARRRRGARTSACTPRPRSAPGPAFTPRRRLQHL